MVKAARTILSLVWGLSIIPAVAQPLKIVELYQSQGCSSCPPAIANVNSLVGQPNIVALTFSVTYWDGLGWKDTFAKPEFTNRQYAYRDGLKANEVYTPQVIIDGQTALVGIERGELLQKIGSALPLSGPSIAIANNHLTIGDGAAATADVWFVRYEPGPLRVAVGRGENAGATIEHRNVVRSITRLGLWIGSKEAIDLPAVANTPWKELVLVQRVNGGPILSAIKVPTPE